MRYTADDILIAREKRVEFQKKLMSKFNMPLLFMRVNYPGINKENTISNNILQRMDELVADIFSSKLEMKLFRNTAEGPSITMMLQDKPMSIKNITVQIEEKHLLGRCIDIDVYDNKTGLAISRKELALPYRKCYICDEEAHVCVRARRHNESEIINFIHNSYKEFLENFYGKKL